MPALDFELDCVEGGLQEMGVALVARNHQFSIEPLGNLVSADEEGQGELL